MTEARINDPSEVYSATVRQIIDAGRKPTIQFSKPGYAVALLKQVNLLCREFGEELEVRFYGHYQTHFDASVISNIPDVQNLAIDCLTDIRNEEAIYQLLRLRRFSFGVYNFDKPHFLEELDVTKLTRLSLTETAKRNFDLAGLAKAKHLETLIIDGHNKNISAITSLHNLTELTLSAITKHQGIEFLNEVAQLRSLSLILGGRCSIDEFQHPSLESLRIIRVRGLERLGSLARFPRLCNLHVEDQIQINEIDFAGVPLQKVVITNCKNLNSLTNLEKLDRLNELRVSRTSLELQALVDRNWPPSVEVALYSGSRKWNDATRQILDKRGYREFVSR
jgi:hypothetical protein